MHWEIVPVDRKETPAVLIGQGRFLFNPSACALIHDDGSYRWAQFFTATEYWKPVYAVKFLAEPADDSLPITRTAEDGKPIAGMLVVDGGLISGRFDAAAHREDGEPIRYAVTLTDGGLLKILD